MPPTSHSLEFYLKKIHEFQFEAMNKFNTPMGYCYLGSQNTVMFHGSKRVRAVLEKFYSESSELQAAFREDTTDMLR